MYLILRNAIGFTIRNVILQIYSILPPPMLIFHNLCKPRHIGWFWRLRNRRRLRTPMNLKRHNKKSRRGGDATAALLVSAPLTSMAAQTVCQNVRIYCIPKLS